jgi:hypothetical protein
VSPIAVENQGMKKKFTMSSKKKTKKKTKNKKTNNLKI